MAQIVAERLIGAPTSTVYPLLANYRDHHHRFLPHAFSEYRVEQGGIGAGTVVSFSVTLGGRTQSYRTEVTEPEPGRVLVEADTLSDAVTTFTVEPVGEQSRVRFHTVWTPRPGVMGWLERLFAPGVLRGLYNDELQRLDAYARGQRLAAGEEAARAQ